MGEDGWHSQITKDGPSAAIMMGTVLMGTIEMPSSWKRLQRRNLPPFPNSFLRGSRNVQICQKKVEG